MRCPSFAALAIFLCLGQALHIPSPIQPRTPSREEQDSAPRHPVTHPSDPIPNHRPSHRPTAHIKNGTLAGRYLPGYDQDLFLGIPYAQPPLHDLRFRPPQSLATAWPGARDASAYGINCVGYGDQALSYAASEDCLTLNIVRPAGYEHARLPVAVWIYGGGYVQGGAADRRYNLTFIVEDAARAGRPIIGVSLNYRVSGWGFLAAREVSESGNANLGLRDQRLALHWVQENIGAFGGDAGKVTIWGESAGASAVGFQLTAYGGRDDGLFRGAMMESGGPVLYQRLFGTDFYQPFFTTITKAVGCPTSGPKSLPCLRRTPFARLNAALNNTAFNQAWVPIVDHDFIQDLTSKQLATGAFVHVPILIGANTDEGFSFNPPPGANTSQELFTAISSVTTSPAFAHRLQAAYSPPDPCFGPPYNTDTTKLCGPLGPGFGAQYRREAALFGDYRFIAARRAACEIWAARGLPAYCYRFNARPTGQPYTSGVQHFQEVAFVFDNTRGEGYDALTGMVDPFGGKPPAYKRLAKLMSLSWVGFVAELDPNALRERRGRGGEACFEGVQSWPRYEVGRPRAFVFDANVTSYVEADTYRAEGIGLLNRFAASELGR